MTRRILPSPQVALLGLLLTSSLALVWVPPSAAAQGLNSGVEPISLAELFPEAVFDPALPTQESVTGVAPGQRPLRPEEVLDYFAALADASPHARLVEFGRTHEGRPLVVLAVSDEATIADLEGFKANHRKLLDPRGGDLPTAEDLAGTRAVAWLAYGIHGDELSSTDAAASVAYRLVAGTDDVALKLRSRLLVLIDPCENPDGRSRYLSQISSFAHRTANPDQDDLSHASVWPWGRGNHYLFDMNRDWFTMTQPESARSREVAHWLPQVLVDSHEMGANATYLFPPPRHPFNPHLPPNTRKWERIFSDDQARALDARGYPYYTGEWNEEFFPGYGSSWSSYQGAVGILYEMSRTSGTLVRKRGGTVRTFAQAVEHQTTSSLANLVTLASDTGAVLADQIAVRAAAVDRGRKGIRAWIYPPDLHDPTRVERFAALLTDQNIEVHRLSGDPVQAGSLVDARSGEKLKRELPVGTIMVRMDQPGGFMVRALLDPHVPMDHGFFLEEREYLEKGKGSRLYETTAWSLALARGLPALWSEKIPGGNWEPWTSVAAAPAPKPVVADFGSLVLEGRADVTPQILVDLLQAGVTVRVSRKPFTVGGQAFGRGALILRAEGNRPDLAAIVDEVAVRYGVAFHPAGTSRAEDGPDLGGPQYPVLVEPRVGVLTGMPVSPSEYGYVWHLLDQEVDLRFSSLDVGRFRRTDLSRYNVLVFPEIYGGAAMYRQLLGMGGMESLKSWIEAGGTAIGLGGGARLLADPETDLTRARFRDHVRETFPSPVWSISAVEAEAAGPMSATGLRVSAPDSAGDMGKTAETRRTSPYDIAPLLGPGARFFAEGIVQGTPLETIPVPLGKWLAPTLPPGRLVPDPEDLAQADNRLRRFMPQGAMLRAELDEEFWLNFGLPGEITVWFGADDSIIGAPGVSVAARFPEANRLHLGGLLWPEAAARLAHTAYATRERRGRGQVILFADHPGFRRWMKESERMLLNAILLGPGLGTRWSSPW